MHACPSVNPVTKLLGLTKHTLTELIYHKLHQVSEVAQLVQLAVSITHNNCNINMMRTVVSRSQTI